MFLPTGYQQITEAKPLLPAYAGATVKDNEKDDYKRVKLHASTQTSKANGDVSKYDWLALPTIVLL